MHKDQTEKVIKKALAHQANNIQGKSETYNRIRENIYQEEQTMKANKFNWRKHKKGLIMVGVLAAASITAIGVGQGTSWVGYSTSNTYQELPSRAEVESKVGFAPKYVEVLPGGYTFNSGGIGATSLQDDTGAKLTEAHMIHFDYQKEGTSQSIGLTAENLKEGSVTYEGSTEVATYEDTTLYYYEQMYKFVPPSYEVTAEDEIAMESGTLEISYGSDEIEIKSVQGVQWYEDGILYQLLGFDTGLEINDLVKMAEAIMEVE